MRCARRRRLRLSASRALAKALFIRRRRRGFARSMMPLRPSVYKSPRHRCRRGESGKRCKELQADPATKEKDLPQRRKDAKEKKPNVPNFATWRLGGRNPNPRAFSRKNLCKLRKFLGIE